MYFTIVWENGYKHILKLISFFKKIPSHFLSLPPPLVLLSHFLFLLILFVSSPVITYNLHINWAHWVPVPGTSSLYLFPLPSTHPLLLLPRTTSLSINILKAKTPPQQSQGLLNLYYTMSLFFWISPTNPLQLDLPITVPGTTTGLHSTVYFHSP